MSSVEIAILAGGKSSRMGSDKAWLSFGSETLLERMVRRLRAGFPHIAIVKAAGQPIPDVQCPILEDLLPERGPIGGLYTALKNLEGEKCLIVSCDLPFVCPHFLRHLAEMPLEGDAIVPEWAGWLQPLQAIYGKTALPMVDSQIRAGRLQMRELLGWLKVRIVQEEEILPFDPHGLTFQNINTPETYMEAIRLMGKE